MFSRKSIFGFSLGALCLTGVASGHFSGAFMSEEKRAIQQAHQTLEEMKELQAQEQAKIDAMSPEERIVYENEKALAIEQIEKMKEDMDNKIELYEMMIRFPGKSYEI